MRAALALLAVLAAAGSALARDESPAEAAKWRRLEAAANRFNAETWVRLEGADGRAVWVRSGDAARLVAGKRPRRVVELWPDSIEQVVHVGGGTRYVVSDETWDCRGEGALTVERWFYHPDGRLMAERVPEPGEFTEDDLIYQAVCKGAPLKETRRWPSAAAVIANEPDEGIEPPGD
jgi:hypothetical protein